MNECESWTIKKAEHQGIDVFELWCWRRLLRVPWTARGSNQSILKEISPGCSLEGLMFIEGLKLQYFGHLMRRADSFEKTLMLGKIEGGTATQSSILINRQWDGWMAALTQWTWVWANSQRWWKTGRPGVWQSMGLQSRTQLTDWTTTLTWASLVLSRKESDSNAGNRLHCRRRRFDPWVGKIPQRRAWQPTSVFLPGESHGQRSLVGHSSWSHKSWTWLSN